jgi:hypothetical protein
VKTLTSLIISLKDKVVVMITSSQVSLVMKNRMEELEVLRKPL